MPIFESIILPMKIYIAFLLFLSCSLTAFSQVDTTQKIVPGRKNNAEQQNKPYVILISADGFRYDYAEKYKAEHLLQLSD
ncbi:MAG: alkaline phosphatase family protein, partial [Mucilaginibacter sp.]|nr:alkaline phosphatase family protein [Mucilaginibacter sp.]